MPSVRTAAKAVLIVDNKLLALRKQDEFGDYFILVGGGQENGEALHKALRRECFEEAGLDVEADKLLFVREYIAKNHNPSDTPEDFHQIDFMFSCHLRSHNVKTPTQPDTGQLGIDWIPLDDLMNTRLYPQAIRKPILHWSRKKQSHHDVYVGDVN